jgi:hypothetical protein
MTAFGEMVENTTYIVETPKCFVCGDYGQVEVPMKGFLIRQLGGLIQEAYPDLDLGLREQMISGTHPNCWELRFGKCETA